MKPGSETAPQRFPLHAGLALVIGLGVLLGEGRPDAQTLASGQNIAPVYEGWWPHDGGIDLWFGYYNRNWEEEIDVPVGPDNHIEPGGPDIEQPTHFFPRRSQFVFKVTVPPDFGDREVVWSLTSNGVNEKAYATLRPEYVVDETVMMANFGAGGQTGFMPDMMGNVAPQLTVEGPKTMTVSAGEPVTFSAVAADDGKPGRRSIPSFLIGQSHFVPNSATGLRLSWFRYRGPGAVTFDPPQTKVWQDRRDGGHSPWSTGWETPPVPTDNRWTVQATFSEPGTYVLRALAHDGGLINYDDVTVTVTR
jgi:hypothetical protein